MLKQNLISDGWRTFRWMLGLTNVLVQEGGAGGAGWGGGIAVFWRRGIDVTLRKMSQYYIDVDVREEDGWRSFGSASN